MRTSKYVEFTKVVLNNSKSYQLKACEKLINKEAINKEDIAIDHSIPTIKLGGMTIAGIDPRLIKQATFKCEASLNPGSHKFIGMRKDAKIDIKKDTTATVIMELFRDDKGQIALKELSIVFNRAITVKNPASSLQNKPRSSKTTLLIKNTLADVKLKSLSIDQEGNVYVNGNIKTLGIIKKHLPHNMFNIDLPVLDDSFLASLGLASSGMENFKTKEKFKALTERFDVKKALEKLGAIAQPAHYTLNIVGDRSSMSFLKDNTFFRGPKAPIDINLVGTIDLSRQGDIHIIVDGKKSNIACSLGNYNPSLNANIKNINGLTSASVDFFAGLSGWGKDFNIDTFTKQAVKDMLPRRRPVPGQIEPPSSENEFNASAGAKKVDLCASFSVTADVNKTLQRASGQFLVDAKIHEPYVKTQERGLTMDGHIPAKFALNQWSYQKKPNSFYGKGIFSFGLQPSLSSLKKFPELKPTTYQYGLTLDGKKAQITPPEIGLTRFVRPIRNFEGHEERIDGSLTKAPLYTIGSQLYFEQVEKITGAKLRKADEVKLLIDGVESMPERLKLINEAKDYICFQTLVFKNDGSGWQYAHALADAAKRGVRVYGIVDSLGNIETLKGIEKPNAIYEFLRENGVHLEIYNSFLESALRRIFRIVKAHPHVFNIESPKSLISVAQMLRFLERIVQVCESNTNEISVLEKTELKTAIHTMFNGKEGVAPEVAVAELREVLKDNMTSLEELLSLIKRMGKASYRWHEKYLIADHKTAIVGGMNIADEYLRGGTDEKVIIRGKEQPVWRDTDVLLTGDIVKDAYRSFRRNWLHVAHERLEFAPKLTQKEPTDNQRSYAVSMIQHRPLEDGDHKILNYLLYNLRTLKPGEKAWFETVYFLPRGILRALQKELVLAAKRGVDVRILTNSESTSDFSLLVDASVFDLRELLAAKARVFKRNQERMVHAKVMVLGSKLTMIGSWNCDNRSAAHDSEDVCAIYDNRINAQMTEILFTDMLEQSDEITLDKINNRTFSQEIKSAGMLLAGELI